jgi:membrane dipeptidase
MHCDSLTSSLNVGGLANFKGHIQLNKLNASCCGALCFAIFTQGKGALQVFKSALQNYLSSVANFQNIISPARSCEDILNCMQNGKCAALLTVENMGFIGDDLTKISHLKKSGVSMASLVWNVENEYAYPNVAEGDKSYREKRGLKELGRSALYELQKNKIIVDVSHLSDGGFYDVLSQSLYPVVASHSNCAAICNVSRNLTDEQIKALAESGGVMGINFSKNFLGGEGLNVVFNHITHAINCGGEDAVAIGSDFDGCQTIEALNSCEKVQDLLNYLSLMGVPSRVVDKFAYKNIVRIYKEVIG